MGRTVGRLETDHDLILEIRNKQANFQIETQRTLKEKSQLIATLDERVDEIEKNDIRIEGLLRGCLKDLEESEDCLAGLKKKELAPKSYVNAAMKEVGENNRRSFRLWLTVTALVFTAMGTVVGVILAVLSP